MQIFLILKKVVNMVTTLFERVH